MKQLIGCDAHKKFSVLSSIDEKGVYGRSIRVGHDREVFRKFLRELPAGSQIELETRGWPAAWPCRSAVEPCRTSGFPRPH